MFHANRKRQKKKKKKKHKRTKKDEMHKPKKILNNNFHIVNGHAKK